MKTPARLILLTVLVFCTDSFARRELDKAKLACNWRASSNTLQVEGYEDVELPDLERNSNKVECNRLTWKSEKKEYTFISVSFEAKVATTKAGDMSTKELRVFTGHERRLDEKLQFTFDSTPRWLEDGNHLVIVEQQKDETGSLTDGPGYVFKDSNESFIDYMVFKNEYLYEKN